jgi:hypothetical protein
MNRHACGAIAFVLSCALGAGATLLFGRAPARGDRSSAKGAAEPEVARRFYTDVVSRRQGLATSLGFLTDGAERASCSMYLCSDGTRLFSVRCDYASPEVARERFATLLSASGGGVTLAEASDHATVAASTRRGSVILREDAILEPAGRTHSGDSTCGDARLDDRTLRVVFGPTQTHIAELSVARSID